MEVGPAAQLRARSEGEEIRSFPGCALLPGFVNSHSHLELSAFRGFARPSALRPLDAQLSPRPPEARPADFEASALWGAYECARCGITSLADTAYDGRAVARAAGVAGLRARVYQEVFGLDDATCPAPWSATRPSIGGLQDEAAAAGPLVEVGVSPHAPYTVSQRLYREAARFARRAGLRLATHVAESQAEVELLARGTGSIAKAYRLAQMWTGTPWGPPRVRPIEYVAAAGVLGPDTLVIHAVAGGPRRGRRARRERRRRRPLPPLELPACAAASPPSPSSWPPACRWVWAPTVWPPTTRSTCSPRCGPRWPPPRCVRRRSPGNGEPAPPVACTHSGERAAHGHAGGGAGPRVGAASPAVWSPARAPTSSRCACRPRARADGPFRPRAQPVVLPALVIRGKAEDVRMTMAAGRVVFDGGSPPAEVLVRLPDGAGEARSQGVGQAAPHAGRRGRARMTKRHRAAATGWPCWSRASD